MCTYLSFANPPIKQLSELHPPVKLFHFVLVAPKMREGIYNVLFYYISLPLLRRHNFSVTTLWFATTAVEKKKPKTFFTNPDEKKGSNLPYKKCRNELHHKDGKHLPEL